MPQARSFKNEACLKLSNKEKDPFVKVGFVQDAHGIRGELYIKIPSGYLDWLSDLKEFQLQTRDGKTQPLNMTLEKARPHKEGMVLKAKEILDRNRAEELKGYSFLIPESFLESEVGETVFLRELLEFKVQDQDKTIGTVVGFMDNGAHDLLRVQSDSGEHLVPFVEAFIAEIDYQNKVIHMTLPEGLIE